jgi:hypothetical protein
VVSQDDQCLCGLRKALWRSGGGKAGTQKPPESWSRSLKQLEAIGVRAKGHRIEVDDGLR